MRPESPPRARLLKHAILPLPPNCSVRQSTTLTASMLLACSSGHKERSEEPTKEPTKAVPVVGAPCPALSVTHNGEPVVFDSARGFYDAADGAFAVSLLRDVEVPCDDIVRDRRRSGGSPTKLDVSVLSNPDAGFGRVAVHGYNKFASAFEVVNDGRGSDARIALCLPEPLTLQPSGHGTFVAEGLVQGEYCGEAPAEFDPGIMAAGECAELQLRMDGNADVKYHALAFGEPGKDLEVRVFGGAAAMSCDASRSGERRPWLEIRVDEDGGSLQGPGWVHGFRMARPVRFGEAAGDRVAVCVVERKEWNEGLDAVFGLVQAQYCGRAPATVRTPD